MGFSNAMRFTYLGLLATFWVLSGGVNADDGENPKSNNPVQNVFTDNFSTYADNFKLEAHDVSTSNYSLGIITNNAHTKNTTLYLCKATPQGVNVNTTISAQSLGDYCVGSLSECEKDLKTMNGGSIENEVTKIIRFTLGTGSTSLSYFFVCFVNLESGFCASTSGPLKFPGLASVAIPDVREPKELVAQMAFKPAFNQSDVNLKVLATNIPAPVTQTTIVVPLTTPTGTDTSNTPDAAPTQSSDGLSTGAKAGIAVGALGVVVIILLAALLCLRKRHRRSSAPDQIMLNQSSADSHDLITEKETERNSPQSYEAPTPVYGANLNVSPKSQTRHSALAPYEELPSQPYTGSAAAIPRRKPTLSPKSTSASSNTNQTTTAAVGLSETATGATASSSKTPPTISREVSAASTIGPPSRTTPPTTSEASPPARDFEEYRDVPTTYADRHTPQVFEGGLQAPFLGSESNISRESMSEADIARLTEEEEERRIDAAIAEAERKRRP